MIVTVYTVPKFSIVAKLGMLKLCITVHLCLMNTTYNILPVDYLHLMNVQYSLLFLLISKHTTDSIALFKNNVKHTQ